LICRAFVERYNSPKVYNLISWAGPHDGQYGVPDLNYYCSDYDCNILDSLFSLLLDGGYVSKWLQEHVTFAAYWKDPFNYQDYLSSNIFLADINNEKSQKNSTYKKKNIESLNAYSLVYSTNDRIVIPNVSPWFNFFENGQDSKVFDFKHSDQYLKNFIGLRTLYDKKKLYFFSVPCGHQDIPRDDCKKYYTLYTKQFLNNTL